MNILDNNTVDNIVRCSPYDLECIMYVAYTQKYTSDVTSIKKYRLDN